MKPYSDIVFQRLQQRILEIPDKRDYLISGTLNRVVGLKLEATGFHAPIGSLCQITLPNQNKIEAEIVGFSNETLYLMSTENTHGVMPGAIVAPCERLAEAPVGIGLLGRVIDGRGQPIDDLGPLNIVGHYPLLAASLNPLKRHPIEEPLDVGIRPVNSLLTIGKGQRMGLFAGSGVGKSVLLSMMTRYTEADIVVVGLIGERGREVKEFIEYNLGPEGLRRSVIVAAPADTSPLMRIHGAWMATSIAEYFRDQGHNVLLLMDSLTRFAMAQRQLGLAIGEPPTTKGYPPSAFARLADLIERAGNAEKGGGSITAIYTVLTEGDDQQDPVADTARSILDGHIVLSRRLAEMGHYPAIDIEASISRVMSQIVSPEHLQRAQTFKRLYAHYRENHDLIQLGAYQPGNDPLLDHAINLKDQMQAFLCQETQESQSFMESEKKLTEIFSE